MVASFFFGGDVKLFRHGILLGVALALGACGKAAVKPGATAGGFRPESLREAPIALRVDTALALSGLTPAYQEAFDERFGSAEAFSAWLSARLLDLLNNGSPAIAAAITLAADTRYILVVRDLALARGERELPTALLPTGGQRSLQSAGGGTSQSWNFSFAVEIREIVRRTEGVLDTAGGKLRHAFEVTGAADVPLFAYKTALLEAVNVAADKAARHLRGSER